MAAKKTISDEIFCQTYILQFDAAAAAKAAGSNAKDRRQAGYQLLEKAVVQTRIDELILERIERLRMSQDHVVLELAEIAFSSLLDFADWDSDSLTLKFSSTLDPAKARTIKSVKHTRKRGKIEEDTLEITREDKMKALELLGRHLGMWGDTKSSGNTEGVEAFIGSIAAIRVELATKSGK